MNAINFSCQGESHIATGKVCQDYSYSQVYENGNAIAIVCDGHGGKRYFRSEIGAKIAAEVAERKVKFFIEEVGTDLLAGKPFTQYASLSEQISKQDFDKVSTAERAFRQLFGSIIYEWNTIVAEHAATNPISEEEKAGLEDRWIADFENGRSLEKVYGCTLIVYASTPSFWFAFQIGDGKCFSFDKNGDWSEPIPWDDRCFLNKTTSICDSSAIDEFRCCFDGSGNFPIAMILGSDGIDDSFGAETNQANFYIQILKSIVKEGLDNTREEIESTLPQLSKIGSQDDMSIAMVFDLDEVKQAYSKLIEWQISNVKQLIFIEDCKIENAREILTRFESCNNLTKQNVIDLQYANADEKRATESKAKLEDRLGVLMGELNGKTDVASENEIDQSEPASDSDNSPDPEMLSATATEEEQQ